MIPGDPDPRDLLRELLDALGHFSGARTESPEQLWSLCIQEVRANKQKLHDLGQHDLFVGGEFTLHSGASTDFLIDCDALSSTDIDALARVAARNLPHFGRVISVPRGGDRLAEAMKQWITPGAWRTVICDDVCTTGASMQEVYDKVKLKVEPGDAIVGLVIFARRPLPSWIVPIFQSGVAL